MGRLMDKGREGEGEGEGEADRQTVQIAVNS